MTAKQKMLNLWKFLMRQWPGAHALKEWKNALPIIIFLDGVSEFVDGRSTRECLTGRKKKKIDSCFLIFFQSRISTLILQIGLPAWSWAAKWSLGLGRSMGMRWFCLGMYGLAFLGQNGPIPFIFVIFSNRTLFRKLLEIYHFFWYSSLVSSSTIFFNPPWHDDMESWN